jgi:hypothetical protein
VLFGVFAIAVPGRAFLLCYSMHLLGMGNRGRLIFGPYFLVPFGLAVAVLLLEIGIVSRRRSVLWTALAGAAGLVVLALVGHHTHPVYQRFLGVFTARLGGDPLFLTLLGLASFYAYAVMRRVPRATEALTAALAALAVVGPTTLTSGAWTLPPRSAPLLAAGALQLGIGVWRRASWRCLLAAGCLSVVAAGILPPEAQAAPFRELIAFHLALLVVLTIGTFDDPFGRALRLVGALAVLLACLAALNLWFGQSARVPQWAAAVYPLIMACLLAGYGLVVGHGPSVGVAALVLLGWLAAAVGKGYALLRVLVTGLDYLAVSLTLFALAIVVSLAKAGVLGRWLTARGGVPRSTE